MSNNTASSMGRMNARPGDWSSSLQHFGYSLEPVYFSVFTNDGQLCNAHETRHKQAVDERVQA